MMNRFFRMASAKMAAAWLLCGVSALMTGCSANQFLSGTDTTPVTGATIQGMVHGGNNPVTGATVQLWAVGAGSYGATATPLGASVQTLAGGTFTIGAYTCPTASTKVYLTSQGGNPGITGNNPNLMLAAALGHCSGAASDTVVINEVTTAAMAFAVGQYFTTTFGSSSTDSFGAPGTTQAQIGITNAFATVNNLVNFSTGSAVTSSTLTNASAAIIGSSGEASGSLTVTATPESAKLNTIADILSACVNSLGTSDPDGYCNTLFSAVVPAGGTTPTDTLQAAVYMSLNPTSNNSNGSTTNLAALYGLQTAIAAPFIGLSSQPTDWTVGIQYTGSTPLADPQNIAVDNQGNIWIANKNSSTGSLTELESNGYPELNATYLGGLTMSETPRNIAIDLNGNAWVTTSSNSSWVFEYGPSTAANGVGLSVGSAAYALAVDGNNNVWVGKESSGTTSSFYEFLNGTLATGSEVEYASDEANVQPEYMAIDTSGNLWTDSGTVSAGTTIVEMSGISTSGCSTFPCNDPTSTYTTSSVSGLNEPIGMAANIGGIWVANQSGNTVTDATSTSTGATYGSGASLNKPQYVAVDGAGEVWISNGASSSNGSVSEFVGTGTGIGTILSAVNTGTAPFTAIGFTHSGINTAEGIAIDPSGDVWVANNTTTGGVFEIVGAAAPTVTPIAQALANTTAANGHGVGQTP